MFCLVPKNGDFKTKVSTETWVSHFSGKAPPCSELQQFPLPAHHPPGKRCFGASGVPMELCGENKMRNETVRRLTSLLLAPLLQRGPGVLAESLPSHWDASSCKRLSSTYVSLGLKNNPFTTQSYLDILQPLSKYEARMGGLIGKNDGSTNSPCRLQTSSGNSSFTGFHGSLF